MVWGLVVVVGGSVFRIEGDRGGRAKHVEGVVVRGGGFIEI